MENFKHKHRKPIFDHKPTSSPSDKLYQTSPAFNRSQSQHQTNRQSQANYQSHIIYDPKPMTFLPNQMVRSASLPKTIQPISIRITSPPPNIISQPIQRPSTPAARMSYQTSGVFRHPSPPKIYSRPTGQQPTLVRTISPSYLRENQNKETVIMRRSEVKPTLVAVQRVMKPVGENQEERSITVLKPNLIPIMKQSCVREPQELRVYESINRKIEDEQKIYKLAQMNDLLAQSYDNLYDQLQILKGDVSEKEVVTQNLFLKKSSLQIQSIFNFYTHETLAKLNKMHREKREKEMLKSKQITELTMKYAQAR